MKRLKFCSHFASMKWGRGRARARETENARNRKQPPPSSMLKIKQWINDFHFISLPITLIYIAHSAAQRKVPPPLSPPHTHTSTHKCCDFGRGSQSFWNPQTHFYFGSCDYIVYFRRNILHVARRFYPASTGAPSTKMTARLNIDVERARAKMKWANFYIFFSTTPLLATTMMSSES